MCSLYLDNTIIQCFDPISCRICLSCHEHVFTASESNLGKVDVLEEIGKTYNDDGLRIGALRQIFNTFFVELTLQQISQVDRFSTYTLPRLCFIVLHQLKLDLVLKKKVESSYRLATFEYKVG